MGALPTLWMKQVEQDSLWTTPQGIITADSGIQSERDVCWVHNLRVFIPPHAAITKQLRLHECNVWAHKHLSVDATVGTILGHITSMPCFLLEQCGSYCLCWSLPLCHRRSQSQEESWKAAQFTQLWQCFHVCSMGTKFSPGKLLHCQQNRSILISPPCATWLTRRLSLLPHRLADIQEGAFDPAVRKNAWWYQVYVCTCNRRFSKVLGTKVLLSFTVTQDLGTKMRDLCWKAMEMVIFIWEDFQLQWLQAALRAALMVVQIHHFQGILPALWNATSQNFVSLKLLTHQECDCGTLSWS